MSVDALSLLMQSENLFLINSVEVLALAGYASKVESVDIILHAAPYRCAKPSTVAEQFLCLKNYTVFFLSYFIDEIKYVFTMCCRCKTLITVNEK